MFQRRALSDRINKINERALILLCQNKNFSFNELRQLVNAIIIHQTNLQVLVTKMFKRKCHLINDATI